MKKIPAVSIIIPMYNAEKYIGECLDSILVQTFQDFEVIIVDDCSTDNSCTIVEKYIKTHTGGGILKLIRRKINSGNPAAPTNEGLSLSRGEYIFLLDDDDLITKTALEELYPIAKKFDADVVHCEQYLHFRDNKDSADLVGVRTNEAAKEPFLITKNIAMRLEYLNAVRFYLPLWVKLIKRDFWFSNGIKLVNVSAQDALCTYCLVLAAEKYVCVPNVVNIHRDLENSLGSGEKDIQKNIILKTKSLVAGFEYLNEFLNGIEIFKQNLDLKYFALSLWNRECCHNLTETFSNVPLPQLYDYACKGFESTKNIPSLSAFMFSLANYFQVILSNQQNVIRQLQR